MSACEAMKIGARTPNRQSLAGEPWMRRGAGVQSVITQLAPQPVAFPYHASSVMFKDMFTRIKWKLNSK
jgi:hypothetical protein